METLPRRLIRFGNSSYIVSLPKEWVDKHRLKKGDILFISENPESNLVILPKEKSKSKDANEEKVMEINFNQRSFDDFRRELTSGYINNIKTIRVVGENLDSRAEQIVKTARALIGFEVLDQSQNEIIIKDFLNIDTISPKKIMRRIDNSVRSMMEDLKKEMSERSQFRQEVYNEIMRADYDVNKLHFLILKISKLGLNNEEIRKSFEMNYDALSEMHGTSLHLEYIGDDIKRIARFLAKTKVNEKQQKQLMLLTSLIDKCFSSAMASYYNEDVKLAREVLEEKQNVLKECDKLFELGSNNSAIGSMIERYKTLYSAIYDIAKLVIY